MKTLIACSIITALVITGCGNQSGREAEKEFPVLKGIFLGQELPGDTVRLFAPGIISTGMNERDAAFTWDGSEMFYTVFQDDLYVIMHTEEIDGTWTQPEAASFSGVYNDAEPIFTANRKGLYFISNRPVDGKEKDPMDYDIWYTYKTLEGWIEPVNLGAPVNSSQLESFPSFTRAGTLYYSRNEPGSNRIMIFRSRLEEGKFTGSEALPDVINVAGDVFNACIAPDESYLIFSSWRSTGSQGKCDYYISYRNKDDEWSEPENLGPEINTDGDEISPHITPGGKYFFFASTGNPLKIKDPLKLLSPGFDIDTILFPVRGNKYSTIPLNGSSDIYWVETASFVK
jgi:hypothetical protein